ncbi:MAG: dTDP-4-dehydrorhamnose reductase [Candidatus Moranbacteria bacterium GW2011_GWE2_35_2-]|nr:MAG: dTDP-4-dehydrorhamnose reductase [Candidatus Moranbacteria bacterium GW2011_GWE2_35_2-]KKQ06149.1 MAG: dTDP-4-dehydrorhamnose reductase [Candidatus Moranbacteria bacterium GW2011_GWF1_36_4]KKQ21979.1 MAG: dTDP-4-dehydrorhamnose reductase [Candidatus Moranbacteria bacterium GW2011_GWF2_37_11]KKQ29100.1 MAG: dTDP-4-dehydrorhamnose reductase [Candidatus Moranbacteria bacterium GW2011_GWD1_37_17]KKQ31085.1 MAG: dTDP-4-dehydrorhamnose reductase [Candidatus Moranbacteria bacterium GW2011_GWE1
MKKILIIGSKGMLGQELVNVFGNDEDCKVVAWDREDIDIADSAQIRVKVGEIKPDVIINAAAYNAVDKCEEDKKEYEIAEIINGKSPGYLAEISKEIGAVFVHYSTDYVFGKEMPPIPEPAGCTGSCASCGLHNDYIPEIGFDEQAKPAPVSKYGETKLMGEKSVQEKGEKYYIIRTSKIFGKPGVTEGAKKSFFDVMLAVGKKAEAGGGEVKAVDEETSCFTYAPDLARKTREIIEAKKEFGIYHVVNSDPCTWYEAVLELYGQAGIKAKVVPVSGDEFPRPAMRPFFSVLLNTKLNSLRNWKNALEEYLNNKK